VPRRATHLVNVASAHLPHTRAGPITVWASAGGVRRLEFGRLPGEGPTDEAPDWPALLRAAVEQLEEYFARTRTAFDIPLDFAGVTRGFQREVYDRLLEIPYGHVISYGQVARDIGKPDMARAVGQAVGANPLPIVVPCHRVVASDGRLTGFGGGLPAKIALLKLEGIDVDGHTASSRVRPEVIPLDL
jgi:methylated-DNA-[protein]-cysteine S-methyltransferase